MDPGLANPYGAALLATRTTMLSLFRAFLGTWAARAFFVVLVGAFGLWGIADVIRNVGHDTALATVGDRRIDPPEFQEAFRRELAQATRMMGSAEPTPAIKQAVATQALDRLVVQAAIAEEVARLGIVVPDAALRQTVFEMPAFKGPSGTFDRAQFDSVMRNNNLSEGRFLEIMRADLGQQQLLGAVGAGVAAPETLVKQAYAFAHETRVGELVELPLSAAADPKQPSDEDLQRQYENDQAAYSAPGYRRIKLVVLSPQTLARGIQVSDADIQAYYDAHKSDYVSEEKRAAEVIAAPSEDAAKKLADVVARRGRLGRDPETGHGGRRHPGRDRVVHARAASLDRAWPTRCSRPRRRRSPARSRRRSAGT